MRRRWTAEDVARNPWQQRAPQLQEAHTTSCKRSTRPVPRRMVWPGAQPLDGGWLLVYQGKLPNMNKECPDWRKRWNLKQACLRQFGILPFPATQFATVTITRVLGPREKVMDENNVRYAAKGLEDSLTNRRPKKNGLGYTGGGNYIIDDGPAHVEFRYVQDHARREEGPCVEVLIQYEKGQSACSPVKTWRRRGL
jgi:hypothetical protein